MALLRLAHRILSTPQITRRVNHIVPLECLEGLFSGIKGKLNDGVPVIIADNVAVYHAHLPIPTDTEENRKQSWLKIPPCPPPFPVFFIEYNTPPLSYGVMTRNTNESYTEFEITEPGMLTPRQLNCLQTGTLIESYLRGTESFERNLNLFDDLPKDAGQWLLTGIQIVTVAIGQLFLTNIWGLLLDDEGKYIESDNKSLITTPQGGRSLGDVMYTLGFMQCKNVDRIDVTDLEGPPPKWCRRQRVREVKYHTLRIDPNLGTRTRSDERKTEGDRSGKALHICRGHFMHCVNDGASKGLFGRGIYGTFWVPSHVRGSADLGKVIPTYNVLAPIAQTTA